MPVLNLTYITRSLVWLSVIASETLLAQFNKIHDIDCKAGSQTVGSLYYEAPFLYAMTSEKGDYNWGTIIRIKPDGSAFEKIFDFNGNNGRWPMGPLTSDGTSLYGMTINGGSNDAGAVFKINLDGTNYTKLYDFDYGDNGGLPESSLLRDGNILYGMTSAKGANGAGTIFKINTNGTDYQKIFDFNHTSTGGRPLTSFTMDSLFLYATTGYGGTFNSGTIFKIKKDGTQFTKLLDLDSTATGYEPYGALLYDGSYLYGTTALGGLNKSGTIFKIKTDGSSFTKLFDFDSINGRVPTGPLVLHDGFLYGTTSRGGTSNVGTIFRIKTDGSSFAKIFDFGDQKGEYIFGSLTILEDNFYGVTYGGGAHGCGIFFKQAVTNPTAVSGTDVEGNYNVFPNPFCTHTKIVAGHTFDQAVLTVTNLFGQPLQVHTNIYGDSFTLLRNGLPSGFYFFHLRNGKEISTIKVLVHD